MRRVLAVSTVGVAIVLLATSAVSAVSPPTIERFPKGDIDLGNLNDGPTGAVCSFPVNVVVHVLGGAHAITFDGQGVGFAALSFGAFRLTITNIDTGESVTINSSGPGGLRGDGLPVVGWGPWVIFEPIDQGGIRYFHGVTRFVPSSYGVHAIPIAGIEENLCDLVA
jgi:hypothetical protein